MVEKQPKMEKIKDKRQPIDKGNKFAYFLLKTMILIRLEKVQSLLLTYFDKNLINFHQGNKTKEMIQNCKSLYVKVTAIE